VISEHASPLAPLGGVDAGGQNVYVAALARALAGRGHQVTVYTRRDDAGLATRVELAPGVQVEHVPAGPPVPIPKDELAPWMPEFGRWLAARWQEDPATRPDVLHAHFWMSGIAAVSALRRTARRPGARIPHVQTFHALGSVKRRFQGEDDTSPPHRLAAERMLATEADLVIATCRDEVAELELLGPPRATRTVPCGVDLDLFTPRGEPAPVRTRAGSRPELRLLTVGRLVPRKGVDTVIHALARVPGARLVVAGGPDAGRLDADPEVVRLRHRAEQAGVAGRVDFLGRVDQAQLPALLRSADVVVTAPWYEPFGIVPLEAMACGRPLVGSAVGGLLDTVVDGRTGLLVPPRDTAALAQALRDLLADPDARRRMGLAARARAEARYGWDRVAEQVEGAYESARGLIRAGSEPPADPSAQPPADPAAEPVPDPSTRPAGQSSVRAALLTVESR
jgi:glycosyltransferase involved in cell wall biosynthesis